jgi:hypothetical protein
MISALIDRVLDITAVTAQIGDKIYPVVAKQTDASPFITVSKASTDYEYAKDCRTDTVFVRFLVYSEYYDALDIIEEAIIDDLDLQSFTFNGTLGDVVVNEVNVENSADDFSEDPRYFVRDILFKMRLNE